MNYRKIFLTIAIMSFTVLSFAQATSKKKKKAPKKESQTEKVAMTPMEAKKAGVKRTLKEKNFHLPDTTHHSR